MRVHLEKCLGIRTKRFVEEPINCSRSKSPGEEGDFWGQVITKCGAPAVSLSINNNNRITNSGFTYDLSGNLTADGTSTFTWNAEGRMVTTAGVTYTYDGDGQRTKKSPAGPYAKLYWYGINGEVLAESNLSGTITYEYIYFNGKRIARRTPAGTVHYYFMDFLASARVITDANGNKVEESDFYPYGVERVITDNIDNTYKFAWHERDGESNLDHAFLRQYSPALGRWHSVDPVHGKPNDPQTWNRYTYTAGNPTNRYDRKGSEYDSCWEVSLAWLAAEFIRASRENPVKCRDVLEHIYGLSVPQEGTAEFNIIAVLMGEDSWNLAPDTEVAKEQIMMLHVMVNQATERSKPGTTEVINDNIARGYYLGFKDGVDKLKAAMDIELAKDKFGQCDHLMLTLQNFNFFWDELPAERRGRPSVQFNRWVAKGNRKQPEDTDETIAGTTFWIYGDN